IHSYFDPIGYGCLTRREQRHCESNIVELNEQLANEVVVDEIDINQTQSQINNQRKVEQSKPSAMTKFMHSIGKTFTAPSSSSSVITSNKKKVMEEISVYRSLAQREYNSIVHEEKYPNAMNFWNVHRIQLKNLYKLTTYHLVTPATSVASESAFSTASYLLRKQRSRLTPQNLSSSMFLKGGIEQEQINLNIKYGIYSMIFYWLSMLIGRILCIYLTVVWITPQSWLTISILLCLLTYIFWIIFIWYISLTHLSISIFVTINGSSISSISPTTISWIKQFLNLSPIELTFILSSNATGGIVFGLIAAYFIYHFGSIYLFTILFILSILCSIFYLFA
ncbi:unnamed protein product, partial [Adineta steineri]